LSKPAFQPTISIITVVYNGEDLLEGTIQSVLNQTYPNIEYIIVDGASKDTTPQIIQRYQAQLSQWVSEPDKGLYDAMNKGLAMATGDYVWFMNAGDRIFSSTTVAEMVAKCNANADVIYGEVMLVDNARQHQGTRSEMTVQKLPSQLNWKSLKRGMVVCHQGFLPRRTLCNPYRLDNLAADIQWVIEILKQSKQNTHTQLILSEYLMGGVSKKRQKQSWKDRFTILSEQYGLINNLWNHFLIGVRYLFKRASY